MNDKTIIQAMGVVIIMLLLLYAYKWDDSNKKLDTIKSNFSTMSDSLEDIQNRYMRIKNEYTTVRNDLDIARSKLIFVQTKLDTITSRRIQTFTEIQTRLIEIKLGLGKFENIQTDNDTFRFE